MKRPLVIAFLVIALVLVCVGIGSVIYFANGFQTNNPFDRNNIAFMVEESKTLKVDAEKPVTLKVADDAGDITVTGGDVETVEVKVVKTAYDSTQARAGEEVKTIKYTIEQNGNAITLRYEIPDSMNFSNNVNTVDFIVTVPTETIVDIDNGFGTVDVADMKGNVDIASDFGGVTVKNIEGALTLENSSGAIEISNLDAGTQDVKVDADFGSVTLEQVNGKDITINSNSGTLTFKNVRSSGDFFARSDFGETDYENGSAASITVESKSGKVTITKVNIRGALTITSDFGEIELNQAMAGSYDLDSNSGGIAIDGAKGNLKAHTDFGSIAVENAQSATLDLTSNSGGIEFSGSLGKGPHIVKSDFGEIRLTLPTDTKLNVDLKTDFGSIDSDLPITVTLNGSSDSDKNQIVGSINGGGEQLTVQTNSGGIDITAIK